MPRGRCPRREGSTESPARSSTAQRDELRRLQSLGTIKSDFLAPRRTTARALESEGRFRSQVVDDLRMVGHDKSLALLLAKGVVEILKPGLDFCESHEVLRLIEAENASGVGRSM